MRPDSEYQAVLDLIRAGLNDCAISRETGIPRTTIRDWRHLGQRGLDERQRQRLDPTCPLCGTANLDPWWYAYLLGLYLGDGCLSEYRRRVFRLRIFLDLKYPIIISECKQAISAMRPARTMAIGRSMKIGCVEVHADWKHWPCLFPQHGPGPKHLRRIQLRQWQEGIAQTYPHRLLRGLIHSDGSRFINRVNGTDYPRYLFTNHSPDIRQIFCRACDDFGISWRQSRWNSISVARSPDVAKLDLVVGPKTQPAPITPPLSRRSRVKPLPH